MKTAMNAKVIEHLEMLKNSKIVNSDFYYNDLTSLCDAISLISKDACGTIELIKESRSINTCNHLIEELLKRFWVIDLLSENIEEKISNNDFLHLDNLFFSYNEEPK